MASFSSIEQGLKKHVDLHGAWLRYPAQLGEDCIQLAPYDRLLVVDHLRACVRNDRSDVVEETQRIGHGFLSATAQAGLRSDQLNGHECADSNPGGRRLPLIGRGFRARVDDLLEAQRQKINQVLNLIGWHLFRNAAPFIEIQSPAQDLLDKALGGLRGQGYVAVSCSVGKLGVVRHELSPLQGFVEVSGYDA